MDSATTSERYKGHADALRKVLLQFDAKRLRKVRATIDRIEADSELPQLKRQFEDLEKQKESFSPETVRWQTLHSGAISIQRLVGKVSDLVDDKTRKAWAVSSVIKSLRADLVDLKAHLEAESGRFVSVIQDAYSQVGLRSSADAACDPLTAHFSNFIQRHVDPGIGQCDVALSGGAALWGSVDGPATLAWILYGRGWREVPPA